jgi:hypothetical protein
MAIKLTYPVVGPITQNFGENPQIYAQWGYAGHNGLDFGIPNGTPVLAAADGIVDKTGFEQGGYGNFVKVSHTDGTTKYATYYAHLQSIFVHSGQPVAARTALGLSNNTGASTGPHLHFGIKIDGQNPAFKGYLDPLPFLSATETEAPAAPPMPATTTPTDKTGTATTGTPASPAAAPAALAGAVDLPGLNLEVINDAVNVRSGPDVTYSLSGQLKAGTKVTGQRLYSQSAWVEYEPGKWCALTYNQSAYMKVNGQDVVNTLPVSNTVGAIRLPSLKLEVTNDFLRVRSGPDVNSPEIAQLKMSDKIVGRQIFANRAWIEIGKDRWVVLTFEGTQYLKFS